MKSSLLYFYRESQKRTTLIVIAIGLLFFTVSLFFQYREKKEILLQQANYVGKSVRNDLLSGNKSSVYEICRSLFSEASLDSLRVYKGTDLICNFKRDSSSLITLAVSVPITFNPSELAVGENIAGQAELTLNAVHLLFFGVFSLASLVVIISTIYTLMRRQQQSIHDDMVLPLDRFSELMITNPRDLQSVLGLQKDSRFVEMESLTEAYAELLRELDKVEKKLIEESKRAVLAEMSKRVAHDIRSPLTAINLVMSQIPSLPGEQRDLLIAAVKRINGIASDLLVASQGEGQAVGRGDI